MPIDNPHPGSKPKIPGAPVIRQKGRPISGHFNPLEIRHFLETQRGIELEIIVRTNGRLEPREKPRGFDDHRIKKGFKRM